MDEKEKTGIIVRATKYEKMPENNISSFISDAYYQGALDQDPISCKKRTEEIIQVIDEAEQQSWTRQEIIKFIKALP